MTVIDMRNVTVAVTFAEEEARFLAGLVCAAVPHLTDTQLVIAQRITAKFILNGEASKCDLIERYGMEAVLDMAERAMAAYPDVERVSLS